MGWPEGRGAGWAPGPVQDEDVHQEWESVVRGQEIIFEESQGKGLEWGS